MTFMLFWVALVAMLSIYMPGFCSSSAIVTIVPTPGIICSLPELEEALIEFEKKDIVDLISNLGYIFVNHNVYNDYGLSLIHRHFEMSEQEILVETLRTDENLSIFSPWKLKGELAQPVELQLLNQYGVSNPEKKFVVPQHWCFTSNGTLEAFEFLTTDNETLPTPSPEFVNELYQALNNLGVAHVVGLRRIVNLRPSWETTPDDLRANVVSYGEKPDELKDELFAETLWGFDKTRRLQSLESTCYGCHGC